MNNYEYAFLIVLACFNFGFWVIGFFGFVCFFFFVCFFIIRFRFELQLILDFGFCVRFRFRCWNWNLVRFFFDFLSSKNNSLISSLCFKMLQIVSDNMKYTNCEISNFFIVFVFAFSNCFLF
jgi:hypothetical protein